MPSAMIFHSILILLSTGIVVSVAGCKQSENELRLGNESVILQQQQNTCGPAALAMLLSEHGLSVTESELEDQLHLGPEGVSLRSIVETAERYGVRLEAWRLRHDVLDSLRSPAILWIDGDHFVVLDSVTSEGAYVRDPAKGRLKVSRQSLLARWDGTAAVGVPTP